MTRIDAYIARQFLRSMVIFLVSMTGLYIVIDAFGNLDEFISYGEVTGSLVGVLWSYYGARALMFFDLTSGLLALISAMFTITWMQRSREITALLAAGVSKWRIAAPTLVLAGLISAAGVANRECLIPQFRERLTRNAQDWMGESGKRLQPRYDNQTDILLAGKHTFAAEQRIEQPHFRLPSELEFFASQLLAENAYYRPASEEHPEGYLLTGVSQPENVAERKSVVIDGRPILLCPGDQPWLAHDEVFVPSRLNFMHLTSSSSWRQFSSTPELISGMRNPALDFGPESHVALHSRLLRPLLDMTLLMLGLPLVMARQDRNVFVAIGLCLLIVGAFFLVNLAFQAAGSNYLIRAPLAAWGPLLLFAPAAAWLAESLRK